VGAQPLAAASASARLAGHDSRMPSTAAAALRDEEAALCQAIPWRDGLARDGIAGFDPSNSCGPGPRRVRRAERGIRAVSDLRKLPCETVVWYADLLIFSPKEASNMAPQQKVLRRGVTLGEEF
jgi:hypothetical protein